MCINLAAKYLLMKALHTFPSIITNIDKWNRNLVACGIKFFPFNDLLFP